MSITVTGGSCNVKSLDNWGTSCECGAMGKKGGMSQAAMFRRDAKKPFGPWEKRPISVRHELRPVFKDPRIETWREENYLNNRYSVQVSDYKIKDGGVVHLWIRHHTGVMPHSWSDLQRIKNEIVGPDYVAIEVYPRVSELTDKANIAHLWVMPGDYVLPFTL